MSTSTELRRTPLRLIDDHTHICDLIFFDGPLLCLFKSQKANWLYLWSDKLSDSTDRWMIFSVNRSELIQYLERNSTLRELLDQTKTIYLLDETRRSDETIHRVLFNCANKDAIIPYLPAVDSYFDESLSPQIESSREIRPSVFHVAIDGDWFVQDLDYFARLYSQLYSIFYCTRPQFVANIGEKVSRYIRSPWTGGFSRVNLFAAMKQMIPSLHDLKIRKIQYASPGHIDLEALESVNASITRVVFEYVARSDDFATIESKINTVLSADKLKSRDLSNYNENNLPISRDSIEYLHQQLTSAAPRLGIAMELQEIAKFSPNVVVTSKVFLAMLSRIRKMGELHKTGLVRFFPFN